MVEGKPTSITEQRIQALNNKLREIKDIENEKIRELKYLTMNGFQKVQDKILKSLNLARSLQTTLEFSGVLRQGNMVTLAHPLLASKAMKIDYFLNIKNTTHLNLKIT